MTTSITVSELAKIAGVNPRTVYLWLKECPSELRDELGDLQDSGSFSLAQAREILEQGHKKELAKIFGELQAAQSAIFSISSSLPVSPYQGDTVIVSTKTRGRPRRRHIPAWVLVDSLADDKESKARITASFLRDNIELQVIGNDTYVAMDRVPAELMDMLYKTAAGPIEEIDHFVNGIKDIDGKIWVKTEDIMGALKWSRGKVSSQGWRAPWRSRRAPGDPYLEYELSSMPVETHKAILLYLMNEKRRCTI